jgi:SAM-dependent methyltransferase
MSQTPSNLGERPGAPRPARESPDVESSTEEYAARFAGRTGEYLLEVQTRAIMDLAGPWRGGSVLDVGGGHAQLCAPLLAAGSALTVHGSSEGCFERVRRLFADRVTCVEGDLLALPFPERSFDLVVSVRMLAHVRDAETFVRELCRVARFAVIVDYPDLYSANVLTPLLYPLKKRVEGNTRTYRIYRRGTVTRLFAQNGFGRPRGVGELFWPLALHRTLGRPSLSRTLEALPLALGLNRLVGTPRVLRAVRL